MSPSHSTFSYRAPCTRTATNSLRRRPRPLSGRGGGEANARSPRSKKSSPFNLVNSRPALGGQTISVRGIERRVSWSHFASRQVFHSLFAMSTHDIRDKLDGLNGASPTAHMLIGFPDAGSMLHSRDATSCLYWAPTT